MQLFVYTTTHKRYTVQYRILYSTVQAYSTANDPETANDTQNGPQMILDRKWSRMSTANDPERKIGMTWTQVSGSSCGFYYYYNKSVYFSSKYMNKN